METIFKGIFDSDITNVINIGDFILCISIALLAGLLLCFAYMYKTRYTKSFVITLSLLPAVVCVVIMMVNGNVGTGVAVAGAFSLVRFRSAPGNAKEITAIFLAMSAGLIAGMGYLAYALLFSIIMCAVFILYNHMDFGCTRNAAIYKTLTITMPEDLNYVGIFDDLFEKYTKSHEMIRVKTTNMGSLFRVSYNVTLKDPTKEKELIDEIRCRNGNLEISVSRIESNVSEL